MTLVLPRLLAPVLPITYSPRYVTERVHSKMPHFRNLLLAKAYVKHKHLGFPYHTFVHCKVFVPAAPRRARASISVPFSELPLTRLLLIFGLVGLYPANNLISRQLILRRRSFQKKEIPILFSYPALASVSQSYSRSKGKLLTCY